MSGYLEQFKSFYNGLERPQQLTLVFSTIFATLAVIGVLLWASADSFKTVYTSNDASRVQSAALALDDAGIPYSITDDGFQIKVSSDHIGQARIVTAGVSSIIGNEILEDMQLGISPGMEETKKLLAKAGELEKTINALDEVVATRVHLVEAQASAFLNRKEESKASVTVQLFPGMDLSPSQIKGITSLVAGAVRGLHPKQVMLTDSSGELLSGTADIDGEASASNAMLDARRNHENRYRQTILEHLKKVLGDVSADHVTVAVTVDVVTAATEMQKHTFIPEDQVTIAETIKESSSKEDQPVGIPGSESNLPSQAPAAEEASSDEKFQSATNYDYSSETEKTLLSPGSPERVSVSVLINANKLDDMQNAAGGETDLESMKATITKAVEAAVGKSSTRQDIVTVDFIRFGEPELASSLAAETVDWESYMKYALMLLVIVLVFAFIVRPIMSTYNQSILQTQQSDLTPEQLEALQDADGSNMALARRLRRMVDSFDTIDAKELNSLVEQHEQPSAEVLRRWLRAS